MYFPNDEFMNYMGYRYTSLEEKAEECLLTARREENSISVEVDRDDLTDDEAELVLAEVKRRLEIGDF